jgi:hypothetical protein
MAVDAEMSLTVVKRCVGIAISFWIVLAAVDAEMSPT